MKASVILLSPRCSVACVLFALIAPASQAQVGANVATIAADQDITSALLGAETWASGKLPGEWTDTSTQSDLKGKELKTLGKVLGVHPQQVQAFFQSGRLTRMDIVFLEAGNFFGFRKSEELKYQQKSDQSRKEERQMEKEIEQLKKAEDKEAVTRRAEFNKLFEQYEKDLPAALEKLAGSPGERVTVGQTRMLKSRALQYATPAVRMRLTMDEGQLVSLAVIPTDTAAKTARLSTVTGSTRRAGAKESVKTLPNGDVLLDGIPMVNQGSRGYCAIGTLAMIGTYYGLQVNIDQLAARAGYKEGDTENAAIIPIYEAAAREGRMRMKTVENFDYRAAMREIDKGHPILVWRWFSRERDEFHHDFAEKFAAQGTALVLPDPRKDKADRSSWPTRETGGHASLITGYNKGRDEVLFTESWGEGNRHRRMRQEEMAATAYVLFTFEP